MVSYKSEEIRLKDGTWINSEVFREEGLKFMKNGFYTLEPFKSSGWYDYWDEQLKRCDKGYEVAGHKITGHHYKYLNFNQIEIVDQVEGTRVSKKHTAMPDFWDGDFDYYWSLEIAKNGVANKDSLLTNDLEKNTWASLPLLDQKAKWLEKVDSLNLKVKPHPDYLDGGYHMIIGKSRRKGYSYKNADICANIYNTQRKSLTVIGAFDKKYLYPEGTMGMASNCLSFINEHTAWGKAREYVDRPEHKRASFREINPQGMPVEAGYQSDIMAITFKDNPEAARGKDAQYVLFEEAGAFPNLKASFLATAPGLTAGRYITGQILIFGTGGDMEVGTVDFAEMFYNPIQFGLMPFLNVWDENAMATYCGFFHPVYMNMEGFYDKQGNSDIKGATEAELAEREKILRASTNSLVMQQRVQEWPLCPSEAFLTVSINDFPIVELRAQYNKVIREKLHLKFGQPSYLTRETVELGEGKKIYKVVAKPDLDEQLQPLWDYKPKIKDLRGAVVIYEYPISNPPPGLYKIGFDPYRQVDGTSLAAIYVYKSSHHFSYTRETIVAEYVGRPYSPDEVNRIAEMLAELYNTEIMHENEVTHVKGYFEKRRKLHLLASQPDSVISSAIKESKVARIYGIHMTDKLKDAGEKYIKEWLLEIRDYDADGKAIMNLETIYDPALLEELILYNRKGNFDRVMAFMMVMFQRAEEAEGKVYGKDNTSSNAKDLLESINNQFQNRYTFGDHNTSFSAYENLYNLNNHNAIYPDDEEMPSSNRGEYKDEQGREITKI